MASAPTPARISSAISGGTDFTDGNLPQYPAAFAKDLDGVMSVSAVGPSLAELLQLAVRARSSVG
jgi:hypothetical protein